MPFTDNPRLQGWLGQWVFGSDQGQRLRVFRTLMAAAVYYACAVGEVLNVAFGFGDRVETMWLLGYTLAGPAVFVLLVRSPWGGGLRDPSLCRPQMVYAVTALLLAYPVAGAARGLTLVLVTLLPVFGFVALSRKQLRLLMGFSLLAFGAMMLALALVYPDRFDPRVEALYFATLAICLLPTVGMLDKILDMQEDLHVRKSALKQALEQIERVSTRDELTGLVNRRHMTVLLDQEIQRRARRGPAFCAVLIDIDYFKRINDVHGHARGDEALCRFSRLASMELQASHVLARWGGEEFLLLLPGTPMLAAETLMAQMRTRMADTHWWSDRPALQVTFSAGLAEDRRGCLSEILERADRALYRAKAEGRDRCLRADWQSFVDSPRGG